MSRPVPSPSRRPAPAPRVRPADAGEALEPALRADMERSFGADFSSVRVHRDAAPGRIGAVAFARGDHLHFAPGRYDPSRRAGRRLLGHELAHVVDQRRRRVRPAPGGAVPEENALPASEGHADRAGAAAADGRVVASGPVPAAAGAAPAVLQASRITSYTATAEKHPLSALNDSFKKQLGDYPYPIQNGKKVRPSEFIKSSNKIEDEVDRPTKVVAEVVDARRTAGSRAAEAPQTEIGNIGEHERAMFNRPITSTFTYAGGHLISDKILDKASYHAYNLVPQLADFNSPTYRVVETMAEDGPWDTVTKTHKTSVPMEMTVQVEYDEDPYTVKVSDLAAWKVIPATTAATDSGKASLTIPRRVPHKWTVDLAIKGPNPGNRYVIGTSDVSPHPLGHLKGDTSKVPLTRQPSQSHIFGVDSVKQVGSAYRVGGKTTEHAVAVQAYPRTRIQQPLGSVPAMTLPVAPVVNPTFVKNPFRAAHLRIPETAPKPEVKKRTRAYAEIEAVTDPTFTKKLRMEVDTRPEVITRDDWRRLLKAKRFAKPARHQHAARELGYDTNILGLL